MAGRRLPNETWGSALARVRTHGQLLAIAWAAKHDATSNERVFTVCVREADESEHCHYRYEQVEIGVSVLTGADAFRRLQSGELAPTAHFRPPDDRGGIAQWVTSGEMYGVTSTLDVPSYYYDAPLDWHLGLPELDSPLSGGGQPYYPRGYDGLLELLYGVTRDQGRIDIRSQIVVRLPYERASLRALHYLDGQGIVVEIREGLPGGAAGHEVHVAWKMHDSDRKLARHVTAISSPGQALIPIGADPAFMSAALLDEHGVLVDRTERYRSPDTVLSSVLLYPAALPEALDFLASVWKGVYGERLLAVRNLTAAAALALPVASRSDFESRLSSISAVLKAMTVPDKLLAPSDQGKIDQSHTIERMRSAVGARLSGADLDSANKALSKVNAVNRLRVALQHPEVHRDLPASLASFNIGYPPDWAIAWDAIRAELITAIAQLRQPLQSL